MSGGIGGDQNVKCLMPGVGLAAVRQGMVVGVRGSSDAWRCLCEVGENSGWDTGLPRFQAQTWPVGASLEKFQRTLARPFQVQLSWLHVQNVIHLYYLIKTSHSDIGMQPLNFGGKRAMVYSLSFKFPYYFLY